MMRCLALTFFLSTCYARHVSPKEQRTVDSSSPDSLAALLLATHPSALSLGSRQGKIVAQSKSGVRQANLAKVARTSEVDMVLTEAQILSAMVLALVPLFAATKFFDALTGGGKGWAD
mmetsp:Transcript_27849/g.44782  ORF Transcript_27849/g.44782 Transcript_27849/m.44782 type:complete len:118 (+) Transcript_27849:91-444(+)|eukprot:CAMPEP_0169096062 /NCGR_PEP_ID=MMETSP1015-20121227/18802_1 /TAXON_ID=342587 /ORGANISM="Karlodinium micrum, Strain CCMP2283" /LENGTH=117 /DNA_ID=CAMNT_0009156809 /DNA_START=81 /DNA_END=434 /DNA_ORIENTATION=+